MGGLANVKPDNIDIEKTAAEGSLENNMKQLITDEAYSQLSQKFPSLVPMIVGVNIMEMIDNTSAIGAAIISNGDSRLIVPIVYVNGNVDATTFIYSEEHDTMLALTKKGCKIYNCK